MTTTVTTQAELDAALATDEYDIIINSPRGVWLTVSASDSATVSAYGSATISASGSATISASDSAAVSASGSATISASGSATVRASGSATVRAYGSATVRAYDSATISAYGSATISAYDSATVRASDSATVRASDSATVSAYDSATISAYDSATVRASDSATVRAYDSATVRASGSATVSASGSATVRAGRYVPVHLHSKRVTLDGGIPIDISDINLEDRQSWLDFHGVTVVDGKAIVYKAVDTNLDAGHSYTITNYPIGGTVTAPDWKPNSVCGFGLHFGFTPHIADGYFTGAGEPRFLECLINVDTFVALGDKCKAQTATVVREVTIAENAISA